MQQDRSPYLNRVNPSFALIGWTRTGKDYLIQDVQRGQLELCNADVNEVCNLNLTTEEKHVNEDTKWVVYAHLDNRVDLTDLAALFDLRNTDVVKQYALAEALKKVTHSELRLQDCPANAFEHVKDTLLVADPDCPTVHRTIRQWYIAIGLRERIKDPLVWVKHVKKQIEQEKFRPEYYRTLYTGCIDVTSDCRFDNELLERSWANGISVPISTIRLHRAAVPMPPKQADRRIDSEHNMDEFATKYLFIPPGLVEYKTAIERFPQYAKYIPIYALKVRKIFPKAN